MPRQVDLRMDASFSTSESGCLVEIRIGASLSRGETGCLGK